MAKLDPPEVRFAVANIQFSLFDIEARPGSMIGPK